MVKFVIPGFQIDYHNFSRWHKKIGVLIGRTYHNENDRYEDFIVNEDLKKAVAAAPKELFTERVETVRRRGKGINELQQVTDRYIQFQNSELQECSLENYAYGAMNTRINYTILYSFLFDDGSSRLYFHLPQKIKTSGTYATSFISAVTTDIEDVIESILSDAVLKKDETLLNEYGIQKLDSNYEIVTIDEAGGETTIEVSIHELEQALYGVRVVEFESVIDDSLMDKE